MATGFGVQIANLAGVQHGVVSRRQLIEMGINRNFIEHRMATGLLNPVHAGVYAVGHKALTKRGRWMAATLSSSSPAVLSHRSAAALWGIGRATLPIELLRLSGGPSASGLWVHRTRDLPATQVACRFGIPVTTVERTLIDLAAVLEASSLADAFSAARRLKLVDVRLLLALMRETPNRKGTRELGVLARRYLSGWAATRSELESRFLELCLRFKLPRPEVDFRLDRSVVDLIWTKRRLILEVDSREFHEDRFDEDRLRDLDHLAKGYETVRVTHRMIEDQPDHVMSKIATILAQPSVIPEIRK